MTLTVWPVASEAMWSSVVVSEDPPVPRSCHSEPLVKFWWSHRTWPVRLGPMYR